MRIIIVAGARPNFMKIAPIIHEINNLKFENLNLEYKLVHTGQHYDKNMSDDFFEQLGIPKPSVNLNCGSGTHAEVTSKIMISFEKFLINNPSDLVLVFGDITSTMACAIVSQKLHTKVAHIEAGIRSGDWSMPEEINRLVTDSITNYFFTTSETANKNLINNGVDQDKIFFVGNTMIDTLINNQNKLIKPKFWNNIGLNKNNFIVLTLHRPANVDQLDKLNATINEILLNSRNVDIVFPMHPRTKKIFNELNISNDRLHIVDPLSYLEFNYLVKNSMAVITDSGGITEETTFMGIPCITLRDNTERPETVFLGTNELIGTDPKMIAPTLNKLFSGTWKKGSIPKFWDGKTASRIVSELLKINNV